MYSAIGARSIPTILTPRTLAKQRMTCSLSPIDDTSGKLQRACRMFAGPSYFKEGCGLIETMVKICGFQKVRCSPCGCSGSELWLGSTLPCTVTCRPTLPRPRIFLDTEL